MRIAIGGFMHESNTFSSIVADVNRFREGSLCYGTDMEPVWREAHHEIGGFFEVAEKHGLDLVPLGMAWATPSGPVANEFFEHFCDTLVTGVRMGRPDGVLIALHGAMATPNYSSADTEVLRRLREAIGFKMPLAATLDFHGNICPEMADYANILVGYQTYPHVDQRSRGILTAELLIRRLRGEISPQTAVVPVPLFINLLGQETSRPPMSNLMTLARAEEAAPNLLSISVMAGFPYADVPNAGASVIAVADSDRELAYRVARSIADQMWEVRKELNMTCPDPREAVIRAIASRWRPVLLLDLGDNIGGGSDGDSTVLLAELLWQKAEGILVVLNAPEAVVQAKAAGIGSRFSAMVGHPPVQVRGFVKTLHHGKWTETEARHGGLRQNDQGHTAVIDLGNDNILVLNSLRTPPFSLGQLTNLGIDPKQQRIIVVKAAVGYRAAYESIAGEVIPVDTPGLTAINPTQFTYTRVRRPMYPLDADC
jgi:microcystin degradation protein MlrC